MMVFDRTMVVTLPEDEELDSDALLSDELIDDEMVDDELVVVVEVIGLVEVLDGCPPRRPEMMAPRSGSDEVDVELLAVVLGAVVRLLEVELVVELEPKPRPNPKRSRLIL